MLAIILGEILKASAAWLISFLYLINNSSSLLGEATNRHRIK